MLCFNVVVLIKLKEFFFSSVLDTSTPIMSPTTGYNLPITISTTISTTSVSILKIYYFLVFINHIYYFIILNAFSIAVCRILSMLCNSYTSLMFELF